MSDGYKLTTILCNYSLIYTKICSNHICPCTITGKETKSCAYDCNLFKVEIMNTILNLAGVDPSSVNYNCCENSNKYIKSSHSIVSGCDKWLERPALAFLLVAYIVADNERSLRMFSSLVNILYNLDKDRLQDENIKLFNTFCKRFFLINCSDDEEIDEKFDHYIKQIYWGLYKLYNYNQTKAQRTIRFIIDSLPRATRNPTISNYED